MNELKEIVIGFLGCGNVGGGVWRLLENMREEIARRDGLSIRVKKVLVRSVKKVRDCGIPQGLLTDNPDDVLADPEITMVAEFMGGEHPAADYLIRALENGKTVVTANKVALALNWPKLQAAAEKTGAGLYYEASVCGAIPVIGALRGSLESNRISNVMGIINGTTNYILTRMSEQGEDYAAVLADAQRLGLAEPDPTSDVEGFDAAYKLSIMASLAFHTRVPFEKVFHEGITGITAIDIACGREMGYVLKLLAIGKRSGDVVEVRVHPTFLPKDHPLSMVGGSFNAVYLKGHACKEMMLQGRGAGDLPTASAVVGDILEAALTDKHRMPTFSNTEETDSALTFTDNWTTRYFIRLSAVDEPGVLASVAGCFADAGVSIATMMQKGRSDDGRVPLIFITHPAEEKAMQAALRKLDPAICHPENVIRVEE
ncbi:MAG: homoserine dehydrogenase [Clostridia bacterium]|nr:homoserine dehydrogenase [Clostridia bacterium]